MKIKEDSLNGILTTTANLHCIVDEDNCYKFISDSIVDFLGYDAGEVTGVDAGSFIHEAYRDIFADGLQYCKDGKTITLALVKLICNDGNLKSAEVSMTSLLGVQPIDGIIVNFRDISDTVPTDRIRSQVVSSHASFFAKHPFGIFHMTVDGLIDQINVQLTKDLGYSLSDIGNRPVMDFLLPVYRRKVFLMYYNAVHRLEPETYDVEVYTRGGQPLHVNFTIVPVVYEDNPIEFYGIVKDISDRIELRESLRRTSVVADRSSNGVVIMNSDRKIEWVNKGFTRMNGFTLEEGIGQDPSYLLKVEGASEQVLDDVRKTLNEGKSIKKEMLCHKKDGAPYWNLVEITPVLNKNNKLERIISIHTDITEKKKAEDDLKRFAEDLYRQNKELHQFAYIVSHNLRSPVANVIGLANLLEIYKDDAETLTAGLIDLFTAANEIDNIIKDLSNILEITNSGSRGLNKEHLNVTELLNQIKADLKSIIVNSSAIIATPDSPCYIHTNKAYLYSVFYNLIGNAIKYRSACIPEVRISYLPHTGQVTFSVADNGIGIDLDKHSNAMFKPYTKFSLNNDGRGLGLFLVKSHVEALGGEIEVKSEIGRGTIFTFTLPC